MTIGDSDTCQDCQATIDPTRRVYRAANGGPRCPVCQVLHECRVEIVAVTTLAAVMNRLCDEDERGRVN